MNLKEKRELFEKIKAQDYVLEKNQSVDEILEIALSEIGNTDPYIRDELALEVAANLIYNDHLSENKLKQLTKRLLSDEFLFYGLDDKKEDSIFKRTFTSLLLTMLFRIPGKENPLTINDLEEVYEKYLTYLKLEYDYRGYIDNKGWAHFFAHSSDLLKYFHQEETFNNDWVKRYLNTILKIVQNNEYVFHHNEDERFKEAFIKLLERDDINQSILENFITKIISYDKVNKLPEDLNSFVNVKNFLRAIYFSLGDLNHKLKELVIEMNGKLNV